MTTKNGHFLLFNHLLLFLMVFFWIVSKSIHNKVFFLIESLLLLFRLIESPL
jgi:hypothetical protein